MSIPGSSPSCSAPAKSSARCIRGLVIDDAGLVETHAYPGGAYFLENPGWLSGGAVTWLCELLSIDGFEALRCGSGDGAAGCGRA